MMEQTMQPPWEVMRWWRSIAGRSKDATGLIGCADGMETVNSCPALSFRFSMLTSFWFVQLVRLLCHVDESWFRLYYYVRTEAPDALQPGRQDGVPEFVDFIAAGVSATKVSEMLAPIVLLCVLIAGPNAHFARSPLHFLSAARKLGSATQCRRSIFAVDSICAVRSKHPSEWRDGSGWTCSKAANSACPCVTKCRVRSNQNKRVAADI
eukprot:SAG31_NODE_6031_length_2202_cov_3.104186_1_plen_209_part_00